MSHESPTRRDLLKPLQLLGLAFGAALFAGTVTLVSMGFFQQRVAGEAERAVVTALVIAGIRFAAKFFSEDAKRERRRRRSNSPISARANRPMVKFSVKTKSRRK